MQRKERSRSADAAAFAIQSPTELNRHKRFGAIWSRNNAWFSTVDDARARSRPRPAWKRAIHPRVRPVSAHSRGKLSRSNSRANTLNYCYLSGSSANLPRETGRENLRICRRRIHTSNATETRETRFQTNSSIVTVLSWNEISNLTSLLSLLLFFFSFSGLSFFLLSLPWFFVIRQFSDRIAQTVNSRDKQIRKYSSLVGNENQPREREREREPQFQNFAAARLIE